MSFALSLTEDVVEVEAGATSPVGLTVVNRGEATDRYEVEVEGIDPEWRFIPVPTFAVEPGESRSEKVFLKPPRLPESVAGSYPFVVRVRSLESGETRTAQALLKLNSFHSLTLDIAPKKGVVSPTTKRNDFRLTVVNLGNSEHTLQLSAQDPDDRCAYEFESDQIVLGPGHQKEIEMVADPKQTPLLSSGRLIGFSVIARSLNERNVSATAQAQLEQRSLLSPATLVAFVLLLGAFFAWWTMRPMPPTVTLQITPMRATQGDTVQIKWVAEHADHVKITVGESGEVVYDSLSTGDPVKYVLTKDGTLPVVAIATRGTERTEDSKRIEVAPLPVVALPVISSFAASSESIRLGASVILRWKAKYATKFAIQPLGKELLPEFAEQEIVPTAAGKQTYTLFAYNAAGKSVTKEVTINVRDESEAQILQLAAEPRIAQEADGGKAVLTWKVGGAAVVELKDPTGATKTVGSEGREEVALTAPATYTLIATDFKGRKSVRKVAIDYKKPPPPEPPEKTVPEKVRAAIEGAGLDVRELEVTLADGVIVLRGIVPSDTDRAYAEQLAATAAGNGATIDNQLTVSRP